MPMQRIVNAEHNPIQDGVSQREEGPKMSRRSLIEWGTTTLIGCGCMSCSGSAQAGAWGYGG